MSSFLLKSSKIDLLLMDNLTTNDCVDADLPLSCNETNEPVSESPDLQVSLAVPTVSKADEPNNGQNSIFPTREIKDEIKYPSGLNPESPVYFPMLNSPKQEQNLGGVTAPNNLKCPTSPLESIHVPEAYHSVSDSTVNADAFLSDVWNSETSIHTNGLAPTPRGTVPGSNLLESRDKPSSPSKSSSNLEVISPMGDFEDNSCARGSALSDNSRQCDESLMDARDESDNRSRLETDIPRAFCESTMPEKLNSPHKGNDGKELTRSDVRRKKQSPKVPRSASPLQEHRCLLCGKQYRHIASLRNHERKHNSGALSAKKFRCPHCAYSSQYNRNVLKHITGIHQNADPFFPANPILSDNSSYPERNTTTGINSTYWNPANVSEHLYKTSERGPPMFGVPNQCFYKQQAVQDSFGKFETVSSASQGAGNTTLEAYRQITPEAMASGQESPSNSLLYCTSVGCGKPFKNMKCLVAHAAEHYREVRFKCPVDGCHFTGQRQENLKRHVNQYHTERKKSLQDLLTQDRSEYSQQLAPSYLNRPQPVVNFPEFCSPATVRNKFTNAPHKRQLMDLSFPSDATGGTQQLTTHVCQPQNPSESFRRLGMDIYSFPGSVANQPNATVSHLQQMVRFGNGSVNESPVDQMYESRDDLFQPELNNSSLSSLNASRSGSDVHPTDTFPGFRAPSTCTVRSESPVSCNRTETSHFDPTNMYENGMNQNPKSNEDWTPGATNPFDKKSRAVRSNSMVGSTVEQLLCAPDPSSAPSDQFFPGSSDVKLIASEEFRSTSRGSPVNHFADGSRKFSDSSTKGNEGTSVEFDSPNHTHYMSDSLPDSVYQKQINPETDAFFTDLQEILARDMSSLNNSTPRTTDWQNMNPASVGLKDDGSRPGELSHSKSPLTGLGGKPICTASLMSGDSGLESWSSSSSCSAGPNGSSVWGPQDNMYNQKSSPCASTPQPSSLSGPGGQDLGLMTNYEGYSDRQPFEDPSMTATANPDFARLPDLSRTPSRSCEGASQGSNGCHSASFGVHQGSKEGCSVLSPVMSHAYQGIRTGQMSDKNPNSAHRLDATPSQMQPALSNPVTSNPDIPCDPNRSAGLPFPSNEHTFPYRRTGVIPDPRAPPNAIPIDPSSLSRQTTQFGQNQDPTHFHHRHLPHNLHHQASLNGNAFMDNTTIAGAPSGNFDMHMNGNSRERLQTCTSLERPQLGALPTQQQQYYTKTNTYPPFEQNNYRAANHPRPIGSMMPTGQPRLESSSNMSNYPNPTQQSVGHRHNFTPCDVNCVVESGESALTSEQAAADVVLKPVTHGATFTTSRPNDYTYSDVSNGVRPDQAPNSAPNARCAWPSAYQVAPYQNYQQQQQQAYKVYYNGSMYDQVPPANNGTMYPIDQYGAQSAYSRQMNMPACDSQIFVNQPQQPHPTSQLMHNPATTSAYPQFVPQVPSQPMDSFTSMDYPHPGRNIPPLSHPSMRQSLATQMQVSGTNSRHPVPQSHPPTMPYTAMDRRVPDIPGTTEVYPNTASGDLNPIWPSADTCSSVTYGSDSTSVGPPIASAIRNGPKGSVRSLAPPTAGLLPAGPNQCGTPVPTAIGAPYAPDFSQGNRFLADSEPNRIPVSCATISGTNTPLQPPSFAVRNGAPLSGHVLLHQQQQQQSGQNPHPPIHVPNQTPDGFDKTAQVCPIVANQ